ncbi:MAG: hypothetical protein M0P69_18690 [Bacteroidales bacterium]|nr:hypothetical protein [Bacteroidales bacterium]
MKPFFPTPAVLGRLATSALVLVDKVTGCAVDWFPNAQALAWELGYGQDNVLTVVLNISTIQGIVVPDDIADRVIKSRLIGEVHDLIDGRNYLIEAHSLKAMRSDNPDLKDRDAVVRLAELANR